MANDFGAYVDELDLSQHNSPNTMQALCDALYKYRVVCVRGQVFTRDSYLRFGRQIGQPIAHVLDHMRMRGYPELMTVGNTELRDREVKIRNGAALWHTDQSYEAVPASATMLYSLIAPMAGGETQFCDMARAYDALDSTTRTRLDDLHMAHKYGYGKRRDGELDVNPIVTNDQDERVPPVFHPLVIRHPITARRSLYALGHGAYAIRDMPDDEAHKLIETLKDHVLQKRFIYRHKYATGELVMWDTLQTMHSASPIEHLRSRENARLLWRISVRGRPPALAA
jgi:alpha-ketoglutarate-dependent taurine dioxygenase